MKVILLQDVAKMGRRYDVINAPDGYAMNKLIPQKMAEPATPHNLKRVEAMKNKLEADRSQSDADFKGAVEALTDKTITITAEANEQEHLFKAIHEEDIVAACKEEGIALSKEQIHIKTPIKALGEFTVELHSGEEKGELTLTVEAK